MLFNYFRAVAWATLWLLFLGVMEIKVVYANEAKGAQFVIHYRSLWLENKL